MIKINKLKEPSEWTRYRMTPGVDYQSIPELVDSLLEEQGYICAYCMRRIPCQDKLYNNKKNKSSYTVTKESHRIEHIKSRELHDDQKLSYSNMVICCPGHIDTEDHCDRLKGSKDLSFTPIDQSFIDTIKYSSDGTISSTNSQYNKEMNEILNLNTDMLRRNRKELWMEIVTLLQSRRPKGQAWSKKELEPLLRKYSEKYRYYDQDRKKVIYQYHPYCGIVIYNLQKKIQSLF